MYTYIPRSSNIRRWNRLYIRTTIFLVFVQCVRVVQLNCVKVKCSSWHTVKWGVCCRVYYFWLFISLIAWGKKLSLSRLVLGSDAVETSSWGQQREQSVRRVARVLDDLSLWISWREGSSPPTMWRAVRTNLCRALQLPAVLFPNQAVMQRSGCSPQCRARIHKILRILSESSLL